MEKYDTKANIHQCLDELQKYCNYEIQRNFNINDYFHDGFIKEFKTIIEFDEPAFYQQIQKDFQRHEYLESIGYNVFRINYEDWNEDKNKVIKMFKKNNTKE